MAGHREWDEVEEGKSIVTRRGYATIDPQWLWGLYHWPYTDELKFRGTSKPTRDLWDGGLAIPAVSEILDGGWEGFDNSRRIGSRINMHKVIFTMKIANKSTNVWETIRLLIYIKKSPDRVTIGASGAGVQSNKTDVDPGTGRDIYYWYGAPSPFGTIFGSSGTSISGLSSEIISDYVILLDKLIVMSPAYSDSGVRIIREEIDLGGITQEWDSVLTPYIVGATMRYGYCCRTNQLMYTVVGENSPSGTTGCTIYNVGTLFFTDM